MPRKIHLSKHNKADLDKLYKYLLLSPTSKVNARNKFILCLFFLQGFKTKTVQLLKQKHYDASYNILSIPYNSKSSRVNKIELEYQTSINLKPLISESTNPEAPLVKSFSPFRPQFVDIPLTMRSLQRIVKMELWKLRIYRNIPPRELRHYCGIRLAHDPLTHKSISKIIGKATPYALTEYKRKAGTYRQKGKI